MVISVEHVGRAYPPTTPYVVTAAKIAEFATAIGDRHPAFFGPDGSAPPTFAAVVAEPGWRLMFDDPELGLDLARMVHAEQRFSYRRPIRAGDAVVAKLVIDRIRIRSGADFITARVDLETIDGEALGEAVATFVHTRPATEVAA